MKLRSVIMAGVFVPLVGFAACKSVETTSAILRNQEGNYEMAIDLANKALANNPKDDEAYFQLGISYSHLDSVGLAYKNFMKAKELNPSKERLVNDNVQSNFARHYNLGLKEDEPMSAAREFSKATQADPRQAIGFFQLARAYDLLGEEDSTYYERALPAIDKVLELSTPAEKHYTEALGLAGKVLAELGKPDQARGRFNRLIEEDPTNYRVIEDLGYKRLDKQDWKGAAIYLDLAAKARAKINADDFNLYYNLGVAHYQTRNEDPEAPSRAVDFYKKALELEPNEPTTIFNIVAAYLFLQDWQQAAAWGEKYVSLKPEDERGWQVLARSYSELGEREKARQSTTRYEELVKQKRGGQ